MLIVMKSDADAGQIERVCAKVRELGYVPHPIPGDSRVAVCITGNTGAVDPRVFFTLPGVKELIPVTEPSAATRRHATRYVRTGAGIVADPKPELE